MKKRLAISMALFPIVMALLSTRILIAQASKTPDALRMVAQYSGADGGEQISAAIADIPIAGGVVSTIGLTGSQSWTKDPFIAVVKPVLVELGPGTVVIGTNVTIPANVTVRFSQGSILSVNAGATLTINGPMEAPITQLFAGAGTIALRGPVDSIYPQWFAGSDLGTQINNAMAACPATGCVIRIPAGRYTLATMVTNTASNVSIIGAGAFATNITCVLNTDCFRLTANPWTTNQAGSFGGFTLTGQGTSNPNAVAVHVTALIGLTLRDLVIFNFQGVNSVGLWLDNGASWGVSGKYFVERTQTLAVHLDRNTVGMKFSVQPGAFSNSFFYSHFLDTRFNVDTDQIGLLMQGDGTLNGSPHLFHSDVRLTFNCANGGTMWKILNGAQLDGNSYHVVGETTSGMVCIGLSTDANTTLGGTGQISLANGGSVSAVAGRIILRPAVLDLGGNYVSLIEAPSTFASRGQASQAGTYIMPDLGAPAGFRQGVGNNLYFDGRNWIALGNGASNSSAGALFDGKSIGFYVTNNTGGSSRAISTAELPLFQRAYVAEDGFHFGNALSNAAPVRLMLSAKQSVNWGTIAGNSCSDVTFSLDGAVPSDSYYVTSTTAPPTGIVFNIFGNAPSAPTVRACNIATTTVAVGNLLMTVDAWRH